VLEFAAGLYEHARFRDSFDPFARKVTAAGEAAALGATLLKLTCPGVPDIYQGDELWALNLVDPDNRRPIDWEERREMLTEIDNGGVAGHGSDKLGLIREALALRARRAEAFSDAYTPLEAPRGVCAFTRGHEVAVIVGLRSEAELNRVTVPSGVWRDVLPDRAEFAHLRLLELS
jgi:(1->4)-alpha-D-glucan 1-alpha-D-glucosylmutase